MRHKEFYVENPHGNYGDKKTMKSKTPNLNPLYEIKLHRFTWPLYPKDLHSNTYNLIHVHDAATSNCSIEYTSALLKGWMSLTQDSKLESFEWEIENGMAR